MKLFNYNLPNTTSFSDDLKFSYLLKWLLIVLVVGILSGVASAIFLTALNFATEFRESHIQIIAFLPLGGLAIGLLYHYYGKDVVKGNNLLLEEFDQPKKTIPLKMAPLVLIGTLLTHLFGGSAGREGTAVQMGAAISDQFTRLFKLSAEERKTLIIIGISGGFSSVFGTPLAGALFALEVLFFSKINLRNIIPSLTTAYIAYYTVEFLNVHHTIYSIPEIPEFSSLSILGILIVGALSGFAALLFSSSLHLFAASFSKLFKYPPLRPLVGGIVIVAIVYFSQSTKFIGLGIPVIVNSFSQAALPSDFLIKILLTAFTIGAGFKGGEVTPLFFIGATLGSALSIFIPLPIALLAGMGFVAVFSGATHTPIACTVMGMELFGIHCGWYVGFACLIAYFCSGIKGIYSSQIVKGPKFLLYQQFKRRKLGDL